MHVPTHLPGPQQVPRFRAKFADVGIQRTDGVRQICLIPIAQPKFTKTSMPDNPLLKVPRKQGEPNPRAPRGSPREAGGTLRRGAIVNSALAIGIMGRRGQEVDILLAKLQELQGFLHKV